MSSAITDTPYKRIDHFREWLSQYATGSPQGLEETADSVRTTLQDKELPITHVSVRKALKDARMNCCYKHANNIAGELDHSMVWPSINEEDVNRLTADFRLVEEAYKAVILPKRKSFPSHRYVLKRLAERREMKAVYDMLAQYGLSEAKERMNDGYWREICLYLGWDTDLQTENTCPRW